MLANTSVDLIMRTDRLKQNRFLAFMSHELKNNAQVIAEAARPSSLQVALELVRLELGLEGVVLQQCQRGKKLLHAFSIPLGKPFGVSNKRIRAD